PRELVSFSCFTPSPKPLERDLGFSGRNGFCSIGNFRHPPNFDALVWLKSELWPAIRRELPGAVMSCYGAYPTPQAKVLESPADGFWIRGPVDDAVAMLSRHRVALAPLRFGAGIKGKILDSWQAGLPVVTTPIGAEGMGWKPDKPWGG